MALFLYKPYIKTNTTLYSTLFIIFFISYVAMAWYDYLYDCRIIRLKRVNLSFIGLFKPPVYSKDQLTSDTNKK